MKRKLVTLDSHAYPTFYKEISETTSGVQIKYNNNPFYIFCKNFEKPPLRPPRAGLSRCNITTVRAPKQTLGADWSGLERTSEPRYFSRLYLAA